MSQRLCFGIKEFQKPGIGGGLRKVHGNIHIIENYVQILFYILFYFAEKQDFLKYLHMKGFRKCSFVAIAACIF